MTQQPVVPPQEAQVIVIGNGPAHFIQGFREETGYQGPLYTDPSQKAYRLLEFKHGLTTMMGLKSLKESWRAATTGYAELKIQGDPQQQGGTLVLGPGPVIHYLYRNREPGDHAPLEEIRAACQASAS